MPLYAGVCEANITPPIGVWMSGYGFRPSGATKIHDELYARALVLDDGNQRLVLISADVIAFARDTVERVRQNIAEALGTAPYAVMLHSTHTHGGPNIGIYRCMGERDTAYLGVLERKLLGIAKQATSQLAPAHFTFGETTAQIGVNRRQSLRDGRTVLGTDYAGAVSPVVQSLCVNHADGRLMALLFSHACHPTTVGGDNLSITAEWCGVAVELLKERFRNELKGIGDLPVPLFLQGCCGDINPNRRGNWEAVFYNGKIVADAAHQAIWNAHGRLGEHLDSAEETISLPMLPPPSPAECEAQIAHWEAKLAQSRANNAHQGQILYEEGLLAWAKDYHSFAGREPFQETEPITLQRFNLGGIQILGISAEVFVQYQLDMSAQSRTPVISLAYTNGCWNYLPTSAEYARGGYEVNDANKYYGTLMYAPESEALVRASAYRLLGITHPDITPYPLLAGQAR
jgi:hypothetical protein